MEATRNCAKVISTIQEAENQPNSVTEAVYEGYISCLVVARYLVMPHVRYAHLGLYIGVRLEGRTTHIWFFGCGFAYTTTMGGSGFKLSFGIIIVL